MSDTPRIKIKFAPPEIAASVPIGRGVVIHLMKIEAEDVGGARCDLAFAVESLKVRCKAEDRTPTADEIGKAALVVFARWVLAGWDGLVTEDGALASIDAATFDAIEAADPRLVRRIKAVIDNHVADLWEASAPFAQRYIETSVRLMTGGRSPEAEP